MEEIGVQVYRTMNFKWISNHQDIHLEGTCYFSGEVCAFITDTSVTGGPLCRIYKLTWIEKLNWWRKQRVFEWTAGYRYTYS